MPKTPKRAGLVPRPGSRFLSEVVASNIRAYRRRRDLTQDQLAERMEALGHGWARATVSEVERNGRSVSVDELAALAMVLEVLLGELVDPAGPDRDERVALDLGGEIDLLDVSIASPWLRSRSRLTVSFDDSGAVTDIVSRPVDDAAVEEWFGDFIAGNGKEDR